MISWLKKHFVPHEHNAFRPGFLHTKNTQRILVLVVVLELLMFVLPTFTYVNRVSNNTNLAAVLPGVLAVLTNEERKSSNMNELVISPLLTQAAEMKAKDMAEKEYFAHTSPEGKTPWYWLNEVGYKYNYAGENLAINFRDSKDVTDAWMNSPTHRANIVKSAYTEVGTGVATGMYEGRRTIFVAQIYANPVKAKEMPASSSESPLAPTGAGSALAVIDAVEKAGTGQDAVKGQPAETELATDETAESTVLGAEVERADTDSSEQAAAQIAQINAPTETPSNSEKINASPRHASDIVFLVILAITILALILNIVIKVNVQHPDLITNGLLIAAILIAILVFNNFMGTKDLIISQGMDYSVEETVNQ